MLYNFKAEVQARCPGSVVEIDTESEGGKIYFKRFFMALNLASRDSRMAVGHI